METLLPKEFEAEFIAIRKKFAELNNPNCEPKMSE